ncbi:MAG: hypothetical protein ACRCW9_09725 [Cetobacterium sp.]
MLPSFVLIFENKYVKVWDGKSNAILYTSDLKKARIFEIGWLRKNQHSIDSRNIKVRPVHKEIYLFDQDYKVSDLNNNDPFNPNQCICCGKQLYKEEFYELKRRGYGSIFDSLKTKFKICKTCKPKDLELWLNEVPEQKGYSEDYKLEDELYDFIETLPVQGQELFYNKNSNEYRLSPTEWILFEKGILSHDSCKDLGIYSPAEHFYYRERFPKCRNVSIKIHSDGSKSAVCHKGAYGKVNKNNKQEASVNTSCLCMKCDSYKK